MNGVAYALVCVVAPAAWGVLMYVVFGWLRRLRAAPNRNERPPADYTI